MRYRRIRSKGGTFFFTVNLADRSGDLLVRHVDVLRASMRRAQSAHPFKVLALAVLPDHVHAVWELPLSDSDYSTRWALIKAAFSRALPATEGIATSRSRKRERCIWQRRFWEHQIRDEKDLERHVDYIHYNPVKHGYVGSAAEWPYSSIHRYIRHGLVTRYWATDRVESDHGYGER